jgi:hypothetical protein
MPIPQNDYKGKAIVTFGYCNGGISGNDLFFKIKKISDLLIT